MKRTFLPLDIAHVRTIAVIGGNATAKFCDTGGSPMIKPPFEITALEGIRNYVAGRAKIVYAEGYYPPGNWGVQYLPDGKKATVDQKRLADEAVAACIFPRQLADTPTATFGPSAYPGTNGVVKYEEGLLLGYRWYNAKHIEPLFPFGYGLSYMHFAYSHLHLVTGGGPAELPLKVEFELANTGERAGAEVAEIYVEPVDPPVFRPVRELKGFARYFCNRERQGRCR